jgi:aryl-alcohol dehydrogenase-like predicted oxidoreductase
LFAIEVQQNAESLDEQIEDLITYFDGDVISYDTAKVYGEGKVVNDGVITYYRVGNARSENVVTTKETYKISFSEILVDADKKSNEGIWRIWIGKSEEDYMIIGISDMPR